MGVVCLGGTGIDGGAVGIGWAGVGVVVEVGGNCTGGLVAACAIRFEKLILFWPPWPFAALALPLKVKAHTPMTVKLTTAIFFIS